MQKLLKITDFVMRVAYLVIYFGAGLWALVFTEHYAASLTLSFVAAEGQGELQVLGVAYFVTAAVFLFQWAKGHGAQIYLNPMLVLSVTLLSRGVSILKGDVSEMLVTLILFEVVFAAWAFWFGRTQLMKTNTL